MASGLPVDRGFLWDIFSKYVLLVRIYSRILPGIREPYHCLCRKHSAVSGSVDFHISSVRKSKQSLAEICTLLDSCFRNTTYFICSRITVMCCIIWLAILPGIREPYYCLRRKHSAVSGSVDFVFRQSARANPVWRRDALSSIPVLEIQHILINTSLTDDDSLEVKQLASVDILITFYRHA